ncbi:CYTH and CHAD domain-containing protein [Sinomonas mesophila]|uniref:CYTH and CHAD domain-containing protein n=1 Tax=Sinomonas mesophila TaxID=1531955 RepID=UPI001115751C|nr:CYTH and CHAD domain-containing protein [Sinomonas mesophila]
MVKMLAEHAPAVLDAAPGDRFPALQALPGVAAVGQTAEAFERDEYFDTQDLRLAGSRVVLFRRTGGQREGWHLERDSDGGQGHRVEPLGDGDGPPAALVDAVQAHVRGSALSPVATVEVRRRTSPLLGSDGRLVAEVSDDHVRGEPLTGVGAPEEWRRWRIELADGSEDLGSALAEAFPEAEPDRNVESLVRTLGTAVADRGRGRWPRSRIVRAFLAYAGEQADTLLELDPLVREDAPDSVHQMRIACRRLRSALSTYRVVVGTERSQSLRDELRWLGKVLGRVRDAEVMRERLEGLLREEPADLVVGPVAQSIAEDLGAEYQEGSAELAEALRSHRYFALLDRLDALVADLAADTGPKGKKPSVKNVTRRDTTRLCKAILAADEARGNEDADEHLHEARKAAKRVRYAAECAAVFGAGKAGKLEKRAHEIQQVLGEHQDGIVTADLLRRLATDAHARGESAFTYGRLQAHEQRLAQESEAAFFTLRSKLPSRLGG